MHTLALPKSVFSSEVGPQRPMAHYELAYLIKKKEKTPRSLGHGDGVTPPPYMMRPLPFHATAQPKGLERLERCVGGCHREIQWQLRHNTVASPEATQPQSGWQTRARNPSPSA